MKVDGKSTGSSKWYAFFPNFLTSMNLVCGSLAIFFVFKGQLKLAVILMFIAVLFDFFDGFAARLLKVSGELGKQLDSLADMVSFGLLPGVIILHMQCQLIFGQTITQVQLTSPWHFVLCGSALLVPVFSALRLAKFNLDTRQSDQFIGVPTPASSIFFASLAWSLDGGSGFLNQSGGSVVLMILTFVFSLLLVSEIPLIALKFKSFVFFKNIYRYAVLLVGLLALIFNGISGLWIVILGYLIISIIQLIIENNSNLKNI